MKKNIIYVAAVSLVLSLLSVGAGAVCLEDKTPVSAETALVYDEQASANNQCENQESDSEKTTDESPDEVPQFTVDGEISVYAGYSYTEVLTSTNEDYLDGTISVDFTGTDKCEKIQVEVQTYVNGQWKTLDKGSKTISYGSRKSFSSIDLYQKYRIKVKCADNNPSNVTLYIKLS